MSKTVPASEFTRNFGRYRMMAQREAVAVSSHGMAAGYFVGPDENETFKRPQAQRRSFETVELAPERVRAIWRRRWMSVMRIWMVCWILNSAGRGSFIRLNLL